MSEKINIIAQGIRGQSKILTIDKGASIKELKELVKNEFKLDDDVMIIYTNQILREEGPDGKKQFLKDYQVRNMGVVVIVLRLHVGSGDSDSYGSDVNLATEPDMFTLDDTEGGQRAKMPCGHVVSPKSLKDYCETVLGDGGYVFRCPFKESVHARFCHREWDLPTVKRMALLTDTKLKEFEQRIAENYIKAWGIKKCPKCSSTCTLQRNTDQRVRCPVCTRNDGTYFEFCWFCLNVWRSSEMRTCGNSECTGQDQRLTVLKNCEAKKVNGVVCPSIRACPNCGLFIEHIEKCKHMSCPCGTKFCFICLKKASGIGNYQCGAFNSICEAAPVQTEIAT